MMSVAVEYNNKTGDIMANLDTNLRGRLKKTTLPSSKALYPLFEAVVNSIHATDDRVEANDLKQTERSIQVKVVRDGQADLDSPKIKAKIIGFEIIDNGIGFNDINYKSFCTLDSDHKESRGCLGVGRLLWLKAFKNISIESYFKDSKGIERLRAFRFDSDNMIYQEKLEEKTSPISTVVKIIGVKKNYEKGIRKEAKTIAKELIEHCLWYFIRQSGAPLITVIDGSERIKLDELFDDYMVEASCTEDINIMQECFQITHVKLKSTPSSSRHAVIYSAADRVVEEKNLIGQVSGLFGVINDGDNDFNYRCFVTSDFLTQRVTSERLGFHISASKGGLFDDTELSWEDINSEIVTCVTKYLDEHLTENKKAGRKRVSDFISDKAPRYRPIFERIPEKEKIIDPDITDKELEIKLHAQLMQIESACLAEGHDLLKPLSTEGFDDYSERVKDYLDKISDLKQSDLAGYVARRRVVLDLLSCAIEQQRDGKYSKENVVHNLIMPMGKDSNNLFSDDSNLWLIDERLAFHNYLGSDKTLNSSPITGHESTKKPDMLALNAYDNPMLVNDGSNLPLASITVVEIKRPMRNDMKAGEEKNPIEQSLGYIERIREGGVKTASGRLVPESNNVPCFCYIVADLTPTMKKQAKIVDLRETKDKLGYFGYNKTYDTYIEVISFDRLINGAEERNKAFFDKLGLPTN